MEAKGSYVSGICKELKASSVGSNFTPSGPNYSSSRDRDNDVLPANLDDLQNGGKKRTKTAYGGHAKDND